MDIINQIQENNNINDICIYYDILHFNKLLSKDKRQLLIIHMNARSVTNKFDELKMILQMLSTKPHVTAISESWLSEENTEYYKIKGYASFHLVRNTRTHGGVSLYISEQLNSTPFSPLTYVSDEIEILTAKFTFGDQSYTVCSVYRPKSKHEGVESFTQEIC